MALPRWNLLWYGFGDNFHSDQLVAYGTCQLVVKNTLQATQNLRSPINLKPRVKLFYYAQHTQSVKTKKLAWEYITSSFICGSVESKGFLISCIEIQIMFPICFQSIDIGWCIEKCTRILNIQCYLYGLFAQPLLVLQLLWGLVGRLFFQWYFKNFHIPLACNVTFCL